MWIAFMRGVNVGGRNRLPMAELRAACTAAGLRKVTTHIASGNLVFDADGPAERLADRVRALVAGRFGLDIAVMVLSDTDLAASLETRSITPRDPRHLHLVLAASDLAPDPERIAARKAPDETLDLHGRHAWLHTPSGLGRSRLANDLDRCLGVPVTARNLRTVETLLAMTRA